jgi:hypothetical protein
LVSDVEWDWTVYLFRVLFDFFVVQLFCFCQVSRRSCHAKMFEPFCVCQVARRSYEAKVFETAPNRFQRRQDFISSQSSEFVISRILTLWYWWQWQK